MRLIAAFLMSASGAKTSLVSPGGNCCSWWFSWLWKGRGITKDGLDGSRAPSPLPPAHPASKGHFVFRNPHPGARRGFFVLAGGALACLSSAQVWEKPIAPGLTYRMEITAAPRLIHALRFTPSAPDLKAVAELAGGTINEEGTVKGRMTPSRMVEANKAIAAINCDFFSFDHGAPIGLMVRNGELITSPFKSRSVFAWGSETQIGIANFRAVLNEESGLNLPIATFNQPVGQNQVGMFSPVAGDVTVGAGGNLMALLKVEDGTVRPDGTISATLDYLIADSQKMNVPEGKLLVVARGNKAASLAALRSGRKVQVKIETAGFNWPRIEQAVGGGPMLVRNGRIAVDAAEQGFDAAFSDARHPRTAVGRTKEGDIWFVALDGRQTISIGATLREMAEIMLSLGCTEAMNLDGGGSTALHILGVTVNRPSDKTERPISSAVLFYSPVIVASSLPATIDLPAKVALGDQFEAKLKIDGVAVPQSEVIWSMQGAAWIDQGGLVRTMEVGKAKISAFARGRVVSLDIDVIARKALSVSGN